jgi:hypothetical protein
MNRQSRPFLAKTVIKQLSPRKVIGSAFYSANRFAELSRDSSPNLSVCSDTDFRGRSASIKRKAPETVSYANMVTGQPQVLPQNNNQCNDTLVEKVNLDATKVQSICEKVSSDLAKVDIQPEVACLLNMLCEAVGIVAKNQLEMVNKGVIPVSAPVPDNAQGSGSGSGSNFNSGMTNLGNVSKKQRPALGPTLLPTPTGNEKVWSPAPATATAPAQVTTGGNNGQIQEEIPKVRTFKDAIKEAERSTLLFNLDMGKVPIMSKDTMNKKATLALAAMAAKKEKKPTSIPSEDAVAAIDDCLNATVGIEFYGATTKSYKHPKDPNSGSYCTVPVRYEFKDKDDKSRAEKILRDLCDIQCTTPYPVMVRESIKQIISKVKTEHPEHLIKVSVDCNKMCFKVSMKARGDGTVVMPWIPYWTTIPIPEEAQNFNIRRVPEDFKLTWPLPKRKPSTEVEVMVHDGEEGPAP